MSDGPFTEAREVLGGLRMWQCRPMEEAVGWARRIPADDDQMVEVRRVFEAEDFGEAFTPDLQAREERLRQEILRQTGQG